MNDIAEIVDLPDRSVQPLVHPLDLAEAAGPYRAAWLIELLTGPPIGLAIGALIWAITGNLIVGLIAAVPVVAVGTYAGRIRRDEAWAFIPRNRQDRGRVLPDAWELAAGIVDGAAVVVAATLVADRLGQPDISIGIREFAFGAGVAVVALVALDLGSSLATGRGTFVGRPWFGVPILVALVLDRRDRRDHPVLWDRTEPDPGDAPGGGQRPRRRRRLLGMAVDQPPGIGHFG